MNLQTEKYLASLTHLPGGGQHILAQQPDDSLIVYQAYNHAIADWAVAHQKLGGNHFSYSRMSWIKPNFLWMMYRCGWAVKENQERVLALRIRRTHFESILSGAVFSSFQPGFYRSHEEWRQQLDTRDVRLQWDPDHDPYGSKLVRRAVQLGLKDAALEQFGKEWIESIEDITLFVAEQRQHVERKDLGSLLVPVERVYTVRDEAIRAAVGIDE